MREFVVTDAGLASLFAAVLPHLDERQRRIVAGAAERSLGRGGIAAVAEATEMSRSTVQKAVGESTRRGGVGAGASAGGGPASGGGRAAWAAGGVG